MSRRPAADGGVARRLLVLGAALAMMLGLHALQVDAAAGHADPLTLGSIGFVILASFTFGEIVAGLGLPKVTGYIASGILLGPSISQLLTSSSVADMRTFNTLALGLIALSAGLELQIASVRRVARTMALTVAAKIPLLVILVGGTLLAAEALVPSLDLPAGSPRVALALIIGILGLGTSPAIALAVTGDTASKGRLTDLVLGIAVVKDLVVVVCLAVTLAIARAMIAPGGEMDPAVFIGVGIELVSSIAFGAALGGLLILYLRFVHSEMLAFSVAVVLLGAEAVQFLHLEFLLVFIVAGFVVTNFSRFEHALLVPIQRVSLPVFVVFFTTAGASLDLRGALKLLPLALLLSAARAGAYWIAARAGARSGGESPAVQSNAWLAYLPQAGVTLGLVLLAGRALPELSGPLVGLGMALVSVNLLVGPVTLGIALRRAGEAGARLLPAASGAEATSPAPPSDDGREAARAPAPSPDEPAVDPALEDALSLLDQELTARIEAFVAAEVAPIVRDETAAYLSLLGGDAPALPAAEARRMLSGLRPAAPAYAAALRELWFEHSVQIGRLPRRMEIPFDIGLLQRVDGDGPIARARKLWGRLLARVGQAPKTRLVPVRMAVRIAVAQRLAEAVRAGVGARFRAEAALLQRVQARIEGHLSGEAALDDLRTILSGFQERLRADLDFAVRRGLREARAVLAVAGGPALPEREVRYSRVEHQVEAALEGARTDAEAWAECVAAAQETVAATAQVVEAGRVIVGLTEDHALAPVRDAVAALLPTVHEVRGHLAQLQEHLTGTPLASWPPAGAMLAQLQELPAPPVRRTVRRVRADFRQRTQPNLLMAELPTLLWRERSTYRLVSPATPVDKASIPAEVTIHEVAVDDRLETELIESLVPALTEAVAHPGKMIAAFGARLRHSVQVAAQGAEQLANADLEDETSRRSTMLGSLSAAVAVLDDLEAELAAESERAAQLSREARQRTTDATRAVLGHVASAGPARVWGWLQVVRERWSVGTEAISRRTALMWERGASLAQRLSQMRLVRDRRIRSGREALDAAGMRAYLDRFVAAPDALPLPGLYAQLFSPAPITDRRLFTARRALLRHVTGQMRGTEWRQPVAILVTGDGGTGRTSLLNMVQLRLAGGRVVRLDAALAGARGLLAGIAGELGAPADLDVLVSQLERRRTVVLIDDLEQWLVPAPGLGAEVNAFLHLVRRTSPQVRWLVSAGSLALRTLGVQRRVEAAFSEIHDLPRLGWRELQEVVEQRQALGGYRVSYANLVPFSSRVGPLRRREQELYFRALRRAVRGNLRDALVGHLRSVHGQASRGLIAYLPLPQGLPFLGRLDPTALGALSVLIRFGPMREADLARALGSAPGAALAIRRLELSGLVEPASSHGGRVSIAPHRVGNVIAGLRSEQVLPDLEV